MYIDSPAQKMKRQRRKGKKKKVLKNNVKKSIEDVDRIFPQQ